MTENHCPRHCRVKLEHIEGDIAKHDALFEGLWEELKMKVPQKLFFWVMGVAVVILLATFGAIYRQGGMTLEKVQAAQVEQAKIQQELKTHTDNSEMIRQWIHEARRRGNVPTQ
jgi:cytochrome b subunit of formate dehydrogenase